MKYKCEAQRVQDSILDVPSIKSQHELLKVFYKFDEKLSFKKATLCGAFRQLAETKELTLD